MTLINKLTRMYAATLSLKSSWTAYYQYGKGKVQRLGFEYGANTIEELYATDFC